MQPRGSGGILEATRQGSHVCAVPQVSGIMTGVAATTSTAQTDRESYILGFQTACMVVGCIGLVAMSCMCVPESRKEGRLRRATPEGLAASPGFKR